MNTTAHVAHARTLVAHAAVLDAIHHLELLANSNEHWSAALGPIVAKLAGAEEVLAQAEREIVWTCSG